MHPIIKFFTNDNNLERKLGFSIDIIKNAKHTWLEGCHNYIQWAFPLKQPSRFNPHAPLLTDGIINMFHNDIMLQARLFVMHYRMMQFFGFHATNDKWNEFIFDELEVRSVEFMRKYDLLWLNPGDHNFLRITRILTSLRLLGLQPRAEHFYGLLTRLYSYPAYAKIIGETTFNYWKEAMECGISPQPT